MAKHTVEHTPDETVDNVNLGQLGSGKYGSGFMNSCSDSGEIAEGTMD